MTKVSYNNQYVWDVLEKHSDKMVLSDVYLFTIKDRLDTFDRKVWRNTSPLIKDVITETLRKI